MAVNNPELDALQALVESEGWRLWLEWYEKEWGGVAFAQKIAAAVGAVAMTTSEAQQALAIIQQSTVALNAVRGLKDWPAFRIQQLKRAPQPHDQPLSRRGPGL